MIGGRATRARRSPPHKRSACHAQNALMQRFRLGVGIALGIGIDFPPWSSERDPYAG